MAASPKSPRLSSTLLEPTGPASGRPDDKLSETHQTVRQDDRFGEEAQPILRTPLRICFLHQGDLPDRRAVVKPVQSRCEKYIVWRFARNRNTAKWSTPWRGVSRSSRTRGWMRWTRQRWACDAMAGRVSRERSTPRGRTTLKRTTKPRGPGTRCWYQAGGGEIDPTGFRPAFNPPMTEARTNSSPGSAA